jgi:hypothetical protein
MRHPPTMFVFDCAKPLCRNPACGAAASETAEWFLPQDAEELAKFRCVHCRAFDCMDCEVCLPAYKFSRTMQRRVAERKGLVRCIDCQCPLCTATDCRTCKVCRDPACKAGAACEKEATPLSSKCAPQTEAAKRCYKCVVCRKQSYKCVSCKGVLPVANFSQAMQVRASRGTTGDMRCIDCQHPQCTAQGCSTCRQCRDAKCTEGASCEREPAPLHAAQMPKTRVEKDTFMCSRCRCMCVLCKDVLPLPRFSQAMQDRASRKTIADIRCIDCQHPPCIEPGCRTCKRCRDVACKRKSSCDKSPKPLNSQHAPQTKKEKHKFVCSGCRGAKLKP